MSHTQVILLESQQGVGKVGETVRVRTGYARNFLLPRGKALIASKDNLAKVAAERAQLEAASVQAQKAAQLKAEGFKDFSLTLSRPASETGQLYGSLKAKDLAAEMTQRGQPVEASQVLLTDALKTIGQHVFKVALHAEVIVSVPLTIQRQSL